MSVFSSKTETILTIVVKHLMNQHSSSKRKYYSPLIGAALATVSLFHFSLPAFAAGTEAGTTLKNRATATYTDENNTNNYNVISNEVTVTVGKVAGITNVGSGNTSTGTILPGQALGFDFTLTNTGNDVSDIFIPDATTIAAAAGTTSNLTIGVVEYSINGAAFLSRPANGIIPNVAVDGEVLVRVNTTIDAGAANGDEIAVQLGNTPPNDNGVDTQNQIDNAGSGDVPTEDVRTETADIANTTVDGDPVNGQREASAVNSASVGSNPLALAQLEKISTGNTASGTPTDLSDDTIAYQLDLNVLNSVPAGYDPSFNFTPENLEGRDYSGAVAQIFNFSADTTNTPDVLANQTNMILVSEAIPASTTLDPSTVTAPANWTPVYTKTPLTTAADEAIWFDDVTNLPAAGEITRVGWVYNARATSLAADPGNGSIAPSAATVATFGFGVVTDGVPNIPATATTASIYGISQIFGSTDDQTDGANGTVTYDESGDQNPNNYNDDGIGFVSESGQFGVADGSIATNIDPGGNTGTGDGGEVNLVELNAIVLPTSDILNGPDSSADAVGNVFGGGTTDDNHDFQNLSVALNTTQVITNATVDGEGDVTSAVDPGAVIFTNTIENSSGDPLTDVILEPVASSVLGDTNARLELFDGATIIISYTDGGTTSTAEYSYTEAGGFAPVNSNPDITVPSIIAGASVNYTVSIDLPVNTPLSTNYLDGDSANANVGAFPVAILAYVEEGSTPGFQQAQDTTSNYTVNQLYAGYLKLDKQATVFRLNDLEDPTSGYTATADGTDPIAGDRIEYKITFTNISESQGASGNGNVTLRVDEIFITEDGTTGNATTANNWALDNNNDDVIDTLHVPSTAAIDVTGNTITTTNITYQNSGSVTTDADTELTLYEANIDQLDPQEDGTFTFTRKVSEASDTP